MEDIIEPGDIVEFIHQYSGFVVGKQFNTVACYYDNERALTEVVIISDEVMSGISFRLPHSWARNNFVKEIVNINECVGYGEWIPVIYLKKISGQITKQIAINSGCSCSICHNFSPFSEPNQPDNTFKCYSCRSNSLRKFY